MMREIEFTILENKPITDDICKMVLECSAGEHGITAPGQFINIKIDGLFLRRPISICNWTETTVTVIYKVVGKGTELLKTYEPGRQRWETASRLREPDSDRSSSEAASVYLPCMDFAET